MERELSEQRDFNTAAYTVELQRLHKILEQLEDQKLREEVINQISVLQVSIRPVVDEYLDRHPEARTHLTLEQLYMLSADSD